MLAWGFVGCLMLSFSLLCERMSYKIDVDFEGEKLNTLHLFHQSIYCLICNWFTINIAEYLPNDRNSQIFFFFFFFGGGAQGAQPVYLASCFSGFFSSGDEYHKL